VSSNDTDQHKTDPADKTPTLVKTSQYLAIGLEFPSTVLGGLIFGYLLDQYFVTSPWYTISLTLLALIGAFVRLVSMLRRLSMDKK
jgi:F0F1-type ATP synthase assembly protein I